MKRFLLRHVELHLSAVRLVVIFLVPALLDDLIDFWRAVAINDISDETIMSWQCRYNTSRDVLEPQLERITR